VDVIQTEIERLEQMIGSERDPEGRGFASLAEALARAGDLERASEVLENGLERLPRFVTGWVVAARVRSESGDPEGARRALDRAVELDPEIRVAVSSLADAVSGQEILEPSTAQPETPPSPEDVAEDPAEDEMLTRTMGEVFAEQGLYAQALDVYRRLLARNPRDVGLSERLGELEREAVRAAGPTPVAGVVEDDPFFDIDALAPDDA
jgi:tetratricopeptide (TPR) repeat protein